MENQYQRQLEQFALMSQQGLIGDRVRAATEEYAEIPAGNPTFLKMIHDFYTEVSTKGVEEAGLVGVLSRDLVTIYRETRERKIELAEAFLKQHTKDFLGVPNTALYHEWEALTEASYAFLSNGSDNFLLYWKDAKAVILAGNEFLDGLFGPLILMLRVIQGKKYSLNVLQNRYGAKVNELDAQLAGQDNVSQLLTYLARPQLRNAIAHQKIWPDVKREVITFKDNDKKGEIDFGEFFKLAASFTYLGNTYLTTIASLAVIESGVKEDVLKLPRGVLKAYFPTI